jgi:hypothetical protein
MKCFEEKYIGIVSRVKVFYYLCKIVGLVPFSFVVNPKDGVESVNTNKHSNVLSVTWSMLVFSMLLVGTVLYCVVMVSKRITTAHYITAFMVSFPMSMFMALMAILLNLTVNQRKFSELLKKLNSIDMAVFKCDGPRSNKWFKVEMGLILFVLVPCLCIDSWLWRHRMGLIGEGTLRMSHLIQLLVIIQFCKLTQFMRYSLKVLNRVLCVSVEGGEGRFCITGGKNVDNKCTRVDSTDIKPTTDQLPVSNTLTNIEDISEIQIISGKRLEVCNLIDIRIIYGQIYDAVECVNSIYGPSVLLEFVRNILSVIVNMLLMIVHLRTPTETAGLFEVSGMCWIVFFIFRNVAIIVSCHVAMSEARNLQDSVQRALLRQHVNTGTLKQLKLFSMQLKVNRIKFTAFGFFTLDLATLSTFIASVITYTVVLAQLDR